MKRKKDRKKAGSRWYKKWWAWVIVVIVLGVVVSAPFIIGQLMNTQHNDPPQPLFTASDILGYFAATLGFLGSVLLGALALWQNQRLHEVNARILENEHRYSSMPQFEVSHVYLHNSSYAFIQREVPDFTDYNGHWQADFEPHYLHDPDADVVVSVELKNVGDGLAKNLQATYITPDEKQYMKKEDDIKDHLTKKYLRFLTKPDQTAIFDFSLPWLSDRHDMKTVGYHCAILHDAGLVADYKGEYAGNGLQFFGVGRLTWDGHELLDKIKSDTVWDKTKETINKKGIPFVLDAVKQIATAITSAMIQSAITGL